MKRLVWLLRGLFVTVVVLFLGASTYAESDALTTVSVHLRMPAERKGATHSAPAAAWLNPINVHAAVSPRPHGPYVLLQKNRMFSPHLLIVSVGSVVHFPNEDPFFHNVFSLFDGKRFDLGLYEAGKTKDVSFSREGLSYIFCNIHPEMSAVIIALATPFYATGSAPGSIDIRGVPPGEYEFHLWVEGQTQLPASTTVRRIVINGDQEHQDVEVPLTPFSEARTTHTNEFGQPYSEPEKSIY